jgi:hypothetical protein
MAGMLSVELCGRGTLMYRPQVGQLPIPPAMDSGAFIMVPQPSHLTLMTAMSGHLAAGQSGTPPQL